VNLNEQGRSGDSNPSGLRFPLATFCLRVIPALARYVRWDTPHRVDWRLSRRVLMIFQGAVSEKCARSREFIFL
jgi:hypothetical protein